MQDNPPPIGHNNPPPDEAEDVPLPVQWKREAEAKIEAQAREWLEIIGPRVELNPFRGTGVWVKWAKKAEIKRLAILQRRADNKRASLKETEAEIRAIAHRCTTRRRRAEGKN